MTNRRSAVIRLAALALATTALGITSAQAQTWPTKTVRLVVPLIPGSGADIVARALAKNLQEA